MPEGVQQQPRRSAAAVVAAGIFSSRIIGFVRESAIAYFLGVSAFADVYRTAIRGPNMLQNLLGEGTLSAAFIPIYSRLVEEGRQEDAGQFAGAIFGLLLAAVIALVGLGVLLAAPLVTVLTPGFVDDAAKVAAGELPVNRFDLAVAAVRIIFPATGVLVLSAWALGVLNSHRRFFLPYFAPVLTSVAVIATLFTAAYLLVGNPLAVGPDQFSADTLTDLLTAIFIGTFIGAVLAFGVQLPVALRLMKHFRPSLSLKAPGVRESLRATGPVVAGRGVYQLSGYLDLVLASLLAAGALSAIGYAQILYMLPVSLFGASVAASELPELARLGMKERDTFMSRMKRSVRQMSFMTVPTVVGYLAFGLLIVSAVFQRGGFDRNDSWLVYVVLGAYSLGVIATTMARMLQNAFYALHDTRTPAKVAVQRVVASTLVAVPLMFLLDRYTVESLVGVAAEPGEMLRFGAVGLALGPSVGAWVELLRLRGALRRQISEFDLPWKPLGKMFGLALGAAAPAALLWWALPAWSPILLTLLVVGLYAALYLTAAHFAGIPEADAWIGRFVRRIRR